MKPEKSASEFTPLICGITEPTDEDKGCTKDILAALYV
jgi:hypothetical protein